MNIHSVTLAAVSRRDQTAGPKRDVILRGAPWRDIQPAEALALWEKTPGLFVLDVRTPAEFATGHIPNAHLIPVDEVEDRLGELPPRDTPMLVHCAAGGRSAAACQTLGQRGYTSLLNLVGGMHGWPGVRVEEAAPATPPPSVPAGAAISYRGGPLTEAQVVGAIRECYDPEIPLNIYDLGLIYGIDIDESRVAVRMTLTSEGCPSARTIPEDVKRKVAALGQRRRDRTVPVQLPRRQAEARAGVSGRTGRRCEIRRVASSGLAFAAGSRVGKPPLFAAADDSCASIARSSTRLPRGEPPLVCGDASASGDF